MGAVQHMAARTVERELSFFMRALMPSVMTRDGCYEASFFISSIPKHVEEGQCDTTAHVSAPSGQLLGTNLPTLCPGKAALLP